MAEEAPAAGDQKQESDRLDPWLKDGNIVLAAQGKYFRVHRSVLSAHSEVFKNMFDCPEPSEGEKELIEECPVVHLHDAAADLQMVLKAIYDRSYPVPCHEKVPFSFVAACLRLGEKYEIQRLSDEGKAKLHCAYESTLKVTARISSSQNGTLSLFPRIADGDPHNFQIMNLLREMDLQDSLPFAMCHCTITCPLTAIVNGYKFNDTVYSLSQENLRSFILMKDILENLRTRLAQTLRVSNGCVVQSSCACHVHRLWSDEGTIGQPFGPWRQEWDKLFCDACRSDLSRWRNSAIQNAWNQIPTPFGFEPWGTVATRDNHGRFQLF